MSVLIDCYSRIESMEPEVLELLEASRFQRTEDSSIKFETDDLELGLFDLDVCLNPTSIPNTNFFTNSFSFCSLDAQKEFEGLKEKVKELKSVLIECETEKCIKKECNINDGNDKTITPESPKEIPALQLSASQFTASDASEDISIETDPSSAFLDWNWYHAQGEKRLKNGRSKRLYYCRNRRLSNCPCKAQLIEWKIDDSLPTLEVKHTHNHHKPQRIKCKQMQMAAECETDSRPKKALPVPAPAALKREEKSAVPAKRCSKRRNTTADSMPRIEGYDVKKGMVLFDDKTLTKLKKKEFFCYVHNSNVLTENSSSVLTTLVIEMDNLPVPCAFYIHSDNEKSAYTYFFSYVKEHLGNMKPRAFFGDFNAKVGEACREIFGVEYYGTYYHFVQDNLNWFKLNVSNKDKQTFDILKSQLRNLSDSISYEDFVKNYNAFKTCWGRFFPSYMSYFDLQWITTVQPVRWARFGRPDMLHSMSDRIAEVWNEQMQKSPIQNVYYEYQNELTN